MYSVHVIAAGLTYILSSRGLSELLVGLYVHHLLTGLQVEGLFNPCTRSGENRVYGLAFREYYIFLSIKWRIDVEIIIHEGMLEQDNYRKQYHYRLFVV